jgi:hypothetical protein
MLDAAAFNKIAAYIQEKKNERPLWNALVNNCVTFGNDIAAYIGLKTPAGANLLKPEVYIDSLREMNGGEPQEALRFAEPASSNSTGLPPPSAPSKKKKSPCRRHRPSRFPAPRADPPAIEWTPFTLAPSQLRLGAAWGDADVCFGSKADKP